MSLLIVWSVVAVLAGLSLVLIAHDARREFNAYAQAALDLTKPDQDATVYEFKARTK